MKKKRSKAPIVLLIVALLLIAAAAGAWYAGLLDNITGLLGGSPEKQLARNLEKMWKAQDASGFMGSMVSEDTVRQAMEGDEELKVRGMEPGDLLRAIMSQGTMKLKAVDDRWEMTLEIPDVNDYLSNVRFEKVASWDKLYAAMVEDIEDGEAEKAVFTAEVHFVFIDEVCYLVAEEQTLDAVYGGMLRFTKDALRDYYLGFLDAVEKGLEE